MSAEPVGSAALFVLLALVTTIDAAANPPAVDYMLQCRGCHLADGAGAPGRVPDLRDRLGLFLTVPGGREYLVRVPGAAQSPLDDARLAAVLNWMVREFGPAPIAVGFEAFDAEEVARTRHEPLIDVDTRRGEILRRIAP